MNKATKGKGGVSPRMEANLRALAQEYPVQKSLYSGMNDIVSELVDSFEVELSWMTTAGYPRHECLFRIDDFLEGYVGDESNWTEEALRTRWMWKRLRLMAREALIELGYPSGPPSTPKVSYIIVDRDIEPTED